MKPRQSLYEVTPGRIAASTLDLGPIRDGDELSSADRSSRPRKQRAKSGRGQERNPVRPSARHAGLPAEIAVTKDQLVTILRGYDTSNIQQLASALREQGQLRVVTPKNRRTARSQGRRAARSTSMPDLEWSVEGPDTTVDREVATESETWETEGSQVFPETTHGSVDTPHSYVPTFRHLDADWDEDDREWDAWEVDPTKIQRDEEAAWEILAVERRDRVADAESERAWSDYVRDRTVSETAWRSEVAQAFSAEPAPAEPRRDRTHGARARNATFQRDGAPTVAKQRISEHLAPLISAIETMDDLLGEGHTMSRRQMADYLCADAKTRKGALAEKNRRAFEAEREQYWQEHRTASWSDREAMKKPVEPVPTTALRLAAEMLDTARLNLQPEIGPKDAVAPMVQLVHEHCPVSVMVRELGLIK